MIINGQNIITTEELELAIVGMSEESKASLRATYNNTTMPSASQQDLDYQKYIKRAAVKDQIMAEMASENMARVRAGVWTVLNLISLTQDAELKLVLDDINTLSFELAQQKLQTLGNPLVTTDIKNGWIMKLQTHLYN
jgi:hypothetical protein